MEAEDRDGIYFELFRKKQREYLRMVIDDALLVVAQQVQEGVRYLLHV